MIVCQDFPYPLNYAGPLDSYNKIKALHAAGYKVYLIATTKKEVNLEHLGEISKFCDQIYLIKRKYSFKNFLLITPFQISSRVDDLEISKIVTKLAGVSIWSIICDGYYGIGILNNLVEKISPRYVYLRVNNNEPFYFRALSRSTRNILKKIYYLIDSLKFTLHENSTLNNVNIDAFLHVSIEEKKYYQEKFPRKKHYFLPAGVDVSKILAYERRDTFSAVFIGSLFMPNNLEGLYWYIQHVHDELLFSFPDYRLYIAGNTRGNLDKKLMFLINQRKNITFIDSPESLESIYKLGSVFINPMINGAGVKLKSLNAICAGLPVVSTLVGNEGTGLLSNEHLLIAEDSKEFYQKVAQLFGNESMRNSLVDSSQKYIQYHYDQRTSMQNIIGEIEGAM